MPSALDGITVVDLSRGMAGSLAAMFLCDNGARVIRVENSSEPEHPRPEGYRIWNRGKESLALALAEALQGLDSGGSPELAVFDKLVRKADVILETFRPSSAYQRLVEFERLRSINSGVIHCSITGYGKRGPLKDCDPDEQLVMARAGISGAAPTFRPGPSYVTHPIPGINSALMAAQGISASLLARQKSGTGRSMETSLLAGALIPASQFRSENKQMSPYRGVPSGGPPFYSVFRCQDGEYLQIACIHTGFAEIAAAVMGIYDQFPGATDDPRRFVPRDEEARREMANLVSATMETRPAHEWEMIFEEADVPFMRARTVEEGMQDPQVLHNGMVVRLPDPEVGEIDQMGLPIKLSERPGRIRCGARKPGEDTNAILAELAQEPDVTPDSMEPVAEMAPPLDGVRVLEVSNVIAGPVIGMYLASLGANVIKMEPLAGEISRAGEHRFFVAGNANKRSIGMNASSPEGRQAAQRIAETVDAVVANTRPGTIRRMGVDREGMGERNLKLVESYVTAFGPDGPYDHRPGLDPLAQALTGLQRNQGGRDNPPIFLAWQAPTDYTAGGMAALGAILALFVREREGVCQRSDTNLLNAGAVVNGDRFLKYEGKSPKREADAGHYGLSALHRFYETSDGWIYLVAEDEDTWEPLCESLGVSGLAEDRRFVDSASREANDKALAEELAKVFAGMSAEESLDRLGRSSIGCSPVSVEQIPGYFEDEHTKANGQFVEHNHVIWGRTWYSARLVRFANTRPIAGRPTPLLGEHTREVLGEAGYTEAEIDDLYSGGIVTTTTPEEYVPGFR